MLLFALWTGIPKQASCEQLEDLLDRYRKNPDRTNLIVELLECVESRQYRISTLIASYIPKAEREDFLQEIFIKACKVFREERTLTNLRGYVYTLVKNECLNFVEKPVNKRQPPKQLDEVHESEIEGINGYKWDFPEIDRKAWLEKFRELLNSKQYDAIIKVYYEGKTYKEAALEMEMGRDPFRGVVHRAVNKLREHCGKDFLIYFSVRQNPAETTPINKS